VRGDEFEIFTHAERIERDDENHARFSPSTPL
jgi:FdhD protein